MGGLHIPHTQLPPAPPMQELDTERWWVRGSILPTPCPIWAPAHLQSVDAGADVIVCLLTEGCQCTRVRLHALPQGDLWEGPECWGSDPTPCPRFSEYSLPSEPTCGHDPVP